MNGSSDLDEFASRKKDESPERTRSVLSGGGTTAVRKVQRRSSSVKNSQAFDGA
jgi:hypothetical protein